MSKIDEIRERAVLFSSVLTNRDGKAPQVARDMKYLLSVIDRQAKVVEAARDWASSGYKTPKNARAALFDAVTEFEEAENE